MNDNLNKKNTKFKYEIITDNANWSFNEDKKFIDNILKSFKIENNELLKNNKYKITYYIDRYKFFSKLNNKFNSNFNTKLLCLDYFHGEPKEDNFYKKCFIKLKKYSEKISLIRVPNQKLFKSMFEYGINKENNLALMPIPVNTEIFSERLNLKNDIRKKLGIPESIFLIGSFQKDGVGWDKGFEPKLIKGPDIFLKTIEFLFSIDKNYSKNIGVLLSGPSRGYIKKGLEKLKIKYWHKNCDNLSGVAKLYNAIDAYFISSRLEGGPKSFLESVSSMVPLISTPVGQVVDLYNEKSLIGNSFEPEEYAIILDKLIRNYSSYLIKLRNHYTELSDFYSYHNQAKVWHYKFKELLIKY